MQHLIVTLIFVACLYVVIRRIVRLVSRAKRGGSHCATCSEKSCPLRDAARARNCGCNSCGNA